MFFEEIKNLCSSIKIIKYQSNEVFEDYKINLNEYNNKNK